MTYYLRRSQDPSPSQAHIHAYDKNWQSIDENTAMC
jgi:hypothetical protein